MCGIFGDVARSGLEPSISGHEADLLRDVMISRGPDSGSTWRHENVLLAHRRLAVRTTGPGGDQPLVSSDGRWAVTFNGELYEEQELRRQLEDRGISIPDAGDAATVLGALRAWGGGSFQRMRGMFALAAVDLHSRQLWLARDSFGMKPLYWWADEREIVFASSQKALLAHPRVEPRPDLPVVSAYLTTLRTELDARTLFAGVSAVRPGQVLCFDLDRAINVPLEYSISHASRSYAQDIGDVEAAELIRTTLADSVDRHLVGEVPVACLLSGGIDSTGIAALARTSSQLPTFCAGTRGEEPGDLEFAHEAAAQLGLEHSQVVVDRAGFDAGWGELLDVTGLPVSTPNEIAILDVCRRLRQDGNIVALSGEGADEVLGGYEGVMEAARRFEAVASSPLDGGRLHLELGAWVPIGVKGAVLREEAFRGIEGDRFLIEAYRTAFADSQAEASSDAHPLEAHLRFLRRTNMVSLLGRFDRVSMVAGVEGRCPFADREFIAAAESLPIELKVARPAGGHSGAPEEGAVREFLHRGKRVLRQALAKLMPHSILARPKASFPLPFQDWMASSARELPRSPFASTLFEPHVLEDIAREPQRSWVRAWPVLNIARWGDRWWS